MCVWRGACWLTVWKSITLRGLPSAFGVTTILLFHVTGSLRGTHSMTPRRSSRSSPPRTASFQWMGMGLALLMATGFTFGSTNSLMEGMPVMVGRGCLSQQLKALDLNLSMMYCLMVGRLAGVGSQGRTGGSAGGRVRVGQEQGISSGPITPVFVHLVTCVPLILAIVNWMVSMC